MLNEQLEKEAEIICPVYNIESDANDKEEIMQVYSKSMADCWGIFKRGDINLFGWDIQDKNYCVVCQNIIFDNKQEIKIKELIEYMDKATIPNTDTTILDFLTNGKGIDSSTVSTVDVLDTSNAYDVVFGYNKVIAYENPALIKATDIMSKHAILSLSPERYLMAMRQRS